MYKRTVKQELSFSIVRPINTGPFKSRYLSWTNFSHIFYVKQIIISISVKLPSQLKKGLYTLKHLMVIYNFTYADHQMDQWHEAVVEYPQTGCQSAAPTVVQNYELWHWCRFVSMLMHPSHEALLSSALEEPSEHETETCSANNKNEIIPVCVQNMYAKIARSRGEQSGVQENWWSS